MRNFLFLGDTHGDLAFVEKAAEHARQHNAELLQLGDWGFIWPGYSQLQALSDMLVSHGVTLRFTDGNHDDHPSLRKLQGKHRDAVTLAYNVIYQPRGSVHEDEDGTRFLFLGGAPSIDRDGRVEGLSWWPEETITDAEFALALSAPGPIHVLVTHDAPDYPPGFAPKGSPSYRRAQALSMRRVDSLIQHHRPKRHVHGHWHCRYERLHEIGTRITGLDCNQAPSLSASMLLWSRAGEHDER